MKAKNKRTSKPNKHTSNFVDATRSFFGKQKQRAKEMIGQDNILIVHCKRKTGN